jgi:hypothetical protein
VQALRHTTARLTDSEGKRLTRQAAFGHALAFCSRRRGMIGQGTTLQRQVTFKIYYYRSRSRSHLFGARRTPRQPNSGMPMAALPMKS